MAFLDHRNLLPDLSMGDEKGCPFRQGPVQHVIIDARNGPEEILLRLRYIPVIFMPDQIFHAIRGGSVGLHQWSGDECLRRCLVGAIILPVQMGHASLQAAPGSLNMIGETWIGVTRRDFEINKRSAGRR